MSLEETSRHSPRLSARFATFSRAALYVSSSATPALRPTPAAKPSSKLSLAHANSTSRSPQAKLRISRNWPASTACLVSFNLGQKTKKRRIKHLATPKTSNSRICVTTRRIACPRGTPNGAMLPADQQRSLWPASPFRCTPTVRIALVDLVCAQLFHAMKPPCPW